MTTPTESLPDRAGTGWDAPVHEHLLEAQAAVESYKAANDLLREGLRQIAEGDYPSDAGTAETWAQEIPDRPKSAHWDEIGDAGAHDATSGEVGP